MRCPYHPDQAVEVELPPVADDGQGWHLWTVGCCNLPVWSCPQGELQPMEANFCRSHGEPRPHPERMAHEVHGGRRPQLMQRALELHPMSDGLSTPCVAGDVLVYLAEKGQLVAVDLHGDAVVYLASDVLQASMRLDGGHVHAALRIASGVRYRKWSVRALRDGLGNFNEVAAQTCSGAGSGLLGLPHDHTRLHVGSGLVRLVVEHDPIEGRLANVYRQVTKTWPGPWLIRRVANPLGPQVKDIDLRPADLWQVPVPIPGGVLLLGSMRSNNRLASGALLVPTLTGVT